MLTSLIGRGNQASGVQFKVPICKMTNYMSGTSWSFVSIQNHQRSLIICAETPYLSSKTVSSLFFQSS
jgi:hypothetical protein